MQQDTNLYSFGSQIQIPWQVLVHTVTWTPTHTTQISTHVPISPNTDTNMHTVHNVERNTIQHLKVSTHTRYPGPML